MREVRRLRPQMDPLHSLPASSKLPQQKKKQSCRKGFKGGSVFSSSLAHPTASEWDAPIFSIANINANVFPKIATQSHYPVAFQSRPVGPESFCVVLPSALLVARTACIPTA